MYASEMINELKNLKDLDVRRKIIPLLPSITFYIGGETMIYVKCHICYKLSTTTKKSYALEQLWT